MATNLSSRGYSSSASGSQTKKNVTTTKINLPGSGQNLTAKGYPGSIGVNNARTQGAPSSMSPSYGTGTISTTKVTLPTSSASKSSGGSSGSSGGGYSSSSRSSSGGGYAESAIDYAALEAQAERERQAAAYAALVSAYEQQQREREEYLRQQREAAQNAYNNGMASLNNAYNSQLTSLANNLTEAKNQLQGSYDRTKTSINQDAEGSLRQAYINHMLSQKNLGQQMSAMGLSGGATETTLAGMLNNYGNARNNINTTAANNLANLEGKYNDSLSQAQQAYNNAVANANLQKAQYAMQLEDALAGNQISALTNYQNLLQRDDDRYLDLLQAAIANGANVSYNPTAATNGSRGITVTQAAPVSAATNLATIQALMNAQGGGNGATNALAANDPTTQNYLAAILKQLGG